MKIEKTVIGIWDIRYFEEYGRIQVYKKLRIPADGKKWELVEDYQGQTKADYERIVNETKKNWG